MNSFMETVQFSSGFSELGLIALLCPIVPLIHSILFCRGWKVGLADHITDA